MDPRRSGIHTLKSQTTPGAYRLRSIDVVMGGRTLSRAASEAGEGALRR